MAMRRLYRGWWLEQQKILLMKIETKKKKMLSLFGRV
jgi:hypothetical protein